MRKHWTGLTDDELLKTKVKHLDLDLTETFMQPLVSQLKQELKRRHILFSPQVWLGDEWCNPDGQPGVVVPFCLAHPRLIRLERCLPDPRTGQRAMCCWQQSHTDAERARVQARDAAHRLASIETEGRHTS